MPYIYIYTWIPYVKMTSSHIFRRLCGWLYRSHLISLESAFSGHRFFVLPGGMGEVESGDVSGNCWQLSLPIGNTFKVLKISKRILFRSQIP